MAAAASRKAPCTAGCRGLSGRAGPSPVGCQGAGIAAAINFYDPKRDVVYMTSDGVATGGFMTCVRRLNQAARAGFENAGGIVAYVLQ